MTVLPALSDNVWLGDQLKLSAPLADNLTDDPIQIAVSLVTEITGVSLIFKSREMIESHPLIVFKVSEYKPVLFNSFPLHSKAIQALAVCRLVLISLIVKARVRILSQPVAVFNVSRYLPDEVNVLPLQL